MGLTGENHHDSPHNDSEKSKMKIDEKEVNRLYDRVQKRKNELLAKGWPNNHDAMLSDETYFLSIFEYNAYKSWGIDFPENNT